MKFKIKKLNSKHAAVIHSLIKGSLKEDFPIYLPRIAPIYAKIFNEKFFRKFLNRKTNAGFGAFDQKNNLIASVEARGDFGGVAFVEWFIVKKVFRSMGVGTSLLKKVDQWLIKHKYHYEYLYTETEKNINFYKKRGFEYVGLQKKAWFGIDEHLMQKVLREKPFEEIFEKYYK